MHEEQIAEKLREFERLCHGRGLSLTLQWRMILEAVLERDDHPAVDQIFEAVRSRVPAVSHTTVYRVLDTLVEMRMIQRLPHPGRTVRFDGRTDRHHHAVCESCSRIIDVEDPSLNQLPLPTGDLQGFQVDDYSIVFVGTCPDCREKRPKPDPGEAETPGTESD